MLRTWRLIPKALPIAATAISALVVPDAGGGRYLWCVAEKDVAQPTTMLDKHMDNGTLAHHQPGTSAVMEVSHRFTVSFVHCLTAKSIHLPHVSTRVRESTSLEWFLPHVAKAV